MRQLCGLLVGERSEYDGAMPRGTLTVLESPWDDEDGEVADHSMRPFVEGLCSLYDWRLIYRTFTTAPELANLVNREAFDNSNRSVLYISSHGCGGRIQAGVRETREINLASVADNLVKEVEGVWLGACDLGDSRSLQRFLSRGGTLWAGGYTCSVEWAECMLIDIAVLNDVMAAPRPVRGKGGILRHFAHAFERFDERWVIGEDQDEKPVELGEALRLWGRDVERSRPEDLTEELLDELEWGDIEDEDE